MYEYKAEIIGVYDGDTVTAKVDLGFDVLFENNFRLNGINAPEMKGTDKTAGTISRDALRQLVLGKKVIIKTIKDRQEKYGRYLAVIYVLQKDSLINVNEWMVNNGFAEFKDY